MPTDVIFSKTTVWRRAVECQKKPRDVLDCTGTAAVAIDSGTLRIQSERLFATQWLREALRNVLDW